MFLRKLRTEYNIYELIPGMAHYHIILTSQYCNLCLSTSCILGFQYFNLYNKGNTVSRLIGWGYIHFF